MGYIEVLRQQIGHRPLILTGATLLHLNENRELLLLKRTDNQCWGVPGGMMEPGETPEQTVIRETEEEINVKPVHLELFGVFSGSELYYKYPNGDEVYNVSIVYLCNEIKGEIIVNQEEHSEFDFFSLNKLPKKISPPIIPILTDLQIRYLS